MYILLVAPSGFGKYIIDYSKRMLEDVVEPGTKKPAFHTNPDNMTKASMIDEVASAAVTRLAPEGMGGPINYHALSIYSEDLNAWMSTYDPDTMGALIALWNNSKDYKETRRTSIIKERNIEKPCINLLAGIQPVIMGAIFPEEAWHSGFTRRTIMLYAYESGERRRLNEFFQPNLAAREALCRRLGEFSQIYGECKWTAEAEHMVVEWDFDGRYKTQPTHSRLESYCKNRSLFVQKLAIISTISRTGRLTIEPIDVTRGIEWLLDAERTMPDIFRAMTGKHDGAVMEELWRWMQGAFTRYKGGVPRPIIVSRMSSMVPSDKLPRLLAIAEEADFIRKVNKDGDLYIPGPKGPGSV